MCMYLFNHWNSLQSEKSYVDLNIYNIGMLVEVTFKQVFDRWCCITPAFRVVQYFWPILVGISTLYTYTMCEFFWNQNCFLIVSDLWYTPPLKICKFPKCVNKTKKTGCLVVNVIQILSASNLGNIQFQSWNDMYAF
jgi:hypothetical protein